jgi:uncharacterized phage protein (TIGR02218 family)
MKTLSAALKAHYEQGTTTLATCWKATLANGTVIGATSLDEHIIFGGVLYKSTQSYTASDIESSSDLNPDNLEIEGVLGSPAITDEDIHSGLWDYAEIEIFEVNYKDLTQGKNILRVGRLGEVRGGRQKFVAEMRGMMQAYSRVIGRIVTSDCTADYGDSRCKIDLSTKTTNSVVVGVEENRIIKDLTLSVVDDWYTGAKVTFTSGANAGRSMEVIKSGAGFIELAHPLFDVIEPGDEYMVYVGCTKRFQEDCISKHANGVNFRGFPDLPGRRIYRQGGIDYGDSLGGSGGGGGGGDPGNDFPGNNPAP